MHPIAVLSGETHRWSVRLQATQRATAPTYPGFDQDQALRRRQAAVSRQREEEEVARPETGLWAGLDAEVVLGAEYARC